MRRFVTAFAAGALLLSPLAFADEEQFKAADSDADGALSAEEASAAFGTEQEAFTTADADGNGTLSQEEFDAAMEAGTISAS